MREDHWTLLKLFNRCDRGMSGMVFPDGGAVLDQPVLLLEAFDVIGSAKAALRKKGGE